MKKVLCLTLLIGVVLVTGCEDKTKKYQTVMLDYAKTYYETYMTASNLDIAEISIDMLKKANEQESNKFDLSKLEKCANDSKIELHIKKDTRIIESYNYNMNCKKK